MEEKEIEKKDEIESKNESEIDYQRKEKGILLPLSVVKAIGTKTASEIVNERKNNGLRSLGSRKRRLK